MQSWKSICLKMEIKKQNTCWTLTDSRGFLPQPDSCFSSSANIYVQVAPKSSECSKETSEEILQSHTSDCRISLVWSKSYGAMLTLNAGRHEIVNLKCWAACVLKSEHWQVLSLQTSYSVIHISGVWQLYRSDVGAPWCKREHHFRKSLTEWSDLQKRNGESND